MQIKSISLKYCYFFLKEKRREGRELMVYKWVFDCLIVFISVEHATFVCWDHIFNIDKSILRSN